MICVVYFLPAVGALFFGNTNLGRIFRQRQQKNLPGHLEWRTHCHKLCAFGLHSNRWAP